MPSPLLYGDLLYFTASNKGILSCLNAQTGEPLIERQRLQGIDNIYASPVGAADRIYITSREGNTVVIKRGESKSPTARTRTRHPASRSSWRPTSWTIASTARPAIVGGEIFLRGKRNLYCISAK